MFDDQETVEKIEITIKIENSKKRTAVLMEENRKEKMIDFWMADKLANFDDDMRRAFRKGEEDDKIRERIDVLSEACSGTVNDEMDVFLKKYPKFRKNSKKIKTN